MVEPRLGMPQVGLVLGGERAGKTTVIGSEAAALSIWSKLIFIAGVEYENTEPEFTVLISALDRVGGVQRVSTPRHGQWQAWLTSGAEVRTISFLRRGVDALIATGRAPDVILLAEAGLCTFGHFQAAFTRVAETRGVVLGAGTLKASLPWYADMYRRFKGDNPYNGKSVSLPSWGNPLVYPGGREDPVILQIEETFKDQEWMFQERFAAEPVPSGLLVFGREFSYEDHVVEVEYDEELDVEIAIDPGYAGAYAVLVMQAASASDVRVIDEYYQQYSTWDKAVAWVKALPYWERIKGGVGDVAIHQHHADRSQYENWARHRIMLRAQPVGITDGIGRMRDFLRSPFNGLPRIRIHPRCTGLIWEFGHESYPSDSDGQPIRENPIDRYNHARKAVSYWLVDHYGLSDWSRRKPRPGVDRFG